MKHLFLIITLFFACKIHSQVVFAKKNYLSLKSILKTENNFIFLEKKLDSLKLTFEDQKNNYVDVFLNRDIDFNYKHKRIRVSFDNYDFQIDLITKNDSLFFKLLKTEYFKNFTYQTQNKNELGNLINLRNEYYNSKKNLKDLSKEITTNETYAMYCGESFSITYQGIIIQKLVKDKDIESLTKMLSSYNCEKQSFGVLGFSLLDEINFEIPKKVLLIIEHIKKRNSELQICSGCITGIMNKIYN